MSSLRPPRANIEFRFDILPEYTMAQELHEEPNTVATEVKLSQLDDAVGAS